MASIRPFAALRPRPDLAARICELPYDVLSTEEARALARGNPLSFLHVSKSEIDFPPGTDPCQPAVYAKARENFQRLIAEGALRQDPRPAFHLYRQVQGAHSQVGLVAVASCEEYETGVIRKHELTRPDKEDDRARHIEALNAQTGPAFLVYPARQSLNDLVNAALARPPEIDFVAPDGVRHSAWVVAEPDQIAFIQREFEQVPRLYIADGHHRSAAAVRVYRSRQGAGQSPWYLNVIFPDDQVRILPYNRVLKTLNGLSPAQVLERLKEVFEVQSPGEAVPRQPHTLGFYLRKTWHTLRFRPERVAGPTPADRLDVSLLQQHVLEPLFGIANPRTSDQISFVGGIRGAAELERLVDGGEYACAFSLFPTRVRDLMAIADAGAIMPPKSTWFEPKLRDAMFCHLI